MKKSELAAIFAVIAVEDRRFEQSEVKVNLWFDAIGHHSSDVALLAVKKVLAEVKGEIRLAHVTEALVDITTPSEERIDAAEAWEMANAAIKALTSGQQQAINNLPPIIAGIVRAIGSYEFRTTTSPSILRAQFIKAYNEKLAAARKLRFLSPKLRVELGQTTSGRRLTAPKEVTK